jgi:hypothetical protein
MSAKWTILCFTALVSACATVEQQTPARLVTGGIGLETNRLSVLTTNQRTRAYCVDAQLLLCESETGGRFGPFRCVCPTESVGGEPRLQHD